MPVSSDANRALALLERVQQRVTNNDEGNGVAPQVQTDLNLLTNLLQSPVLRNILKLEDSLEELNQHLIHHPSLLPSDFDIDKTGNLVINQNIMHSHRAGSVKTKGGKASPALSHHSSSKQSTKSPEVSKKDVAITGTAFQQSILQAAAQREIIAIKLNKPEGQSLGFSVVGLRSDHKGDLGIFVQEIQPTGIAGRDGRLAEGDQILAIDGQVLEAAISHQAAIGILQRARGVVDLVVARGVNPEVPHIPLISLPQQQQQSQPLIELTQQQQQLSPDSNSTRSRSSLSSQHSTSSRSGSPLHPAGTAHSAGTPVVDVVQVLPGSLAPPSLGRSPSALSDGSKAGGDMVLNTEWAQVEVVDLINDGSGLGFGIIGGRSTGVVVKTIVPGGVSDRDGRLQSGDHILQIGEVSLRGMGSEQVAAVLRQSGTQVRLVVARPIEPTSPDYQGMSSSAPIVPTKVLGDPEELERHLAMHQNGGFPAGDIFGASNNAVQDAGADVAPAEPFDARFIFTPPTLELPQSDVQLHITPSVPRSEAAIHLSGSHMTTSTTDEGLEAVGQTLDLATDYLPEVENFDVQLKKDNQGLGITIAGYVCEREELSGIFVKSINPGSVADLSGRIQINDQIVEVDGQSLRGFNNHQAVEVLRSTGQIVKLTLARYLRGPKYDQLQQAMAESTIASSSATTAPLSLPPPIPASLSSSSSSSSSASAVPSYRPPTPPPAPSPVLTPRSPLPPALPNVFQKPVTPTPSEVVDQKQRASSIDASPRLSQVPDPESDQLMDLDRFDPLASPSNALDYSSLSPEELDKLIDHVYSAKLSPQCEAAVIAKWRRMVDDEVDIVVAQLSKFQPSGGLGISLEGTVDVEEGREVRPHHYIRSILPEGPVGSNGILHSGDELLEVNGRQLLGLSHVEVVSILKDLPQSVRMVCARRQTHLLPTQLPSRPIDANQDRAAFASRNILGGSLQSLIPPSDRLVKAKSDGSLASTSVSPAADSPLSKSHRSRSLEPLSGLATWSSEPQVIELVKGDRGLGFSILDYQDPMNPSETIIVIRSLVPGGVAQQDGRLIPGDRLLFVNDVNLENASLDEAVQVLKGAPRGLVQIGVAKPHPVSLNEGVANGGSEMQRRDVDSSHRSSSDSSESEEEDDAPAKDAPPNVQMMKVPPPLPQSEPPPLQDVDTDSSESEPPNPLLVPVAMERLLGSTTGTSTSASSSDHGQAEAPLPSALERTVRIKKGSDPLGVNVEVVDGGASGVLVTSVTKGGAVHRDGRIRTGDFLVSVNHETMRSATNAQARAILRRTQLVSTDVSIVYIPAGDAAVYRQTALLAQLAQDVDSNASVLKPSSTFSTHTTSSRNAYPSQRPYDASRVAHQYYHRTIPVSSKPNDWTEEPQVVSTTSDDRAATISELDQQQQPVVIIQPVSHPTDELPLDPVQPDASVSLPQPTTTITQVTNSSVSPKPGTAVGPNGGSNNNSGAMTAILSRHWGPERSVPIVRDPTKSLGISIVGGKVDVASGSGAPITGIFIKNVLPDSPAGRTGQLRTGDRILAVDGEDLREASHERAVEVIRKAGNPVTFLVQSLVDWEQDQNGPSSLAPSALSRHQDGAVTPMTDAEHLTPLPSLINGDMGMTDTIELPKVAPLGITPPVTPMPEVIQSGVAIKTAKRQETQDDDDEDDDEASDLQGRTTTAAGQEIDRASAGCTKLNAAEKAEDTESPDDFGYTQKKIHKRWGELKGDIVRVDLDRAGPGGGALSTTSLGLSLAGHKDRSVMAVFICGLNPNGIAYKDGRLQVGDELVEVNGNVIHGRCHLNASAIIKSIGGARVTIVALRREGALQEVAVPPITRFPISLEEQPPEERYARFKNLRIITLKKGTQGLGIMIIEGRHAEVGSGIFISDIQPESVAEQAGLAVGDMILCVNKDELLGADYDTAASVLKKAEGILTIVVSNPKSAAPAAEAAAKKEEKPKLPPKPAIAPKPASVSAGRLLNSSAVAHNASSTSLPITATVASGLDVSQALSSQSAPQSPLNVAGNQTSRLAPAYSPSSSPSPSMVRGLAATSVSSLEVASESLTSTAANTSATPVDPLPSLSSSSSSSSFVPLAGRPASSALPATTPGFKGVSAAATSVASSHQAKAVLRQHGGPTSHSKTSLGAPKVPDEPLPDPATCEVKPGKETTIEVNKDKLGLGLSIVGGSDTLLGAILIHEVYPDGAAARDKRLKPGDQILEVNGESFRNITHSRALAVLRQTPAKVKMMVYRDETSLKDDDMLDIIEVELLKKPGRGLGLSIVGRRNGPGVYISDVVKGGAAEADGRLMQGDQILTVNGNDLRTASQEQAAAILKTAMGKIDLKVGRLKAGAASPRSATSAESSPAPSHLLPPAPPVREDSLPSSSIHPTANPLSANDPPLVPTPTTPPPPVPALPVSSSLAQLEQPTAPSVADTSTSSLNQPSPSAAPTFTRIVLERGADGLGFSIVGGLGNPQGDLPIFVKTVFERGAAAQSNLKPGDQIHAVDAVLLEGKTHQEAVALLKNAKGTVTLTIVS